MSVHHRTLFRFMIWAAFWLLCWSNKAGAEQETPSIARRIQNLLTQGRNSYAQKDYPKAESEFGQLIHLCHTFRHSDEMRPEFAEYEVLALVLQGDCYANQSKWKQAIDAYQQAQIYLPDLHLPPSEFATDHARITGRIGKVFHDSGNYQAAVKAYRDALHHVEEANLFNDSIAGELFRNLGTTYMRIGQYRDALEHSKRAIDIFAPRNKFRETAQALITIGGCYEALGQEDESHFFTSIAWYKKALKRFPAGEYPKEKGIVFSNLGKTLQRLGQKRFQNSPLKDALFYYGQALEQYQQVQAHLPESRTWNNIGETHLTLSLSKHADRTFHVSRASAALQKALTIQQERNDRSRLWVTYSNLGRLAEAEGNPEQALKYYGQSIDIFEEVIQESSGLENFTISLRGQLDATYRQMIALLWRMGRREAAFYFSEMARARAFLDQLQRKKEAAPFPTDDLQPLIALEHDITRLERAYRQGIVQPDAQQEANDPARLEKELRQAYREYEKLREGSYITQALARKGESSRPLSLDAIQQSLDRRTTLLSFFMLHNSVLAFIVTHQGFDSVELSIDEKQLAASLRAIRHSPLLRNDSPPQELERLYAQFIAPLSDTLRTPIIGIIPHRELHTLPFAALMPDRGHYFGEAFLLYTLPSASASALLAAREIPQNPTLLAFAYGEADEELPPLNFVEKEVKAIASEYTVREFIGEQAVSSAVKQFAAESSILHLAAHGTLNLANPLFSSIVLADGKLSVDAISRLNLRKTALVVLSACNTNVGKISLGDDVIGLTRSFLIAGAPSVVSSLWPVNDFATAEFMTAFYKELKRASHPSKALQAAQQEMRKRYPHPYYWAGFVLSGHAGIIPKALSRLAWLLAALAAIGIVLLLRTMKAATNRSAKA